MVVVVAAAAAACGAATMATCVQHPVHKWQPWPLNVDSVSQENKVAAVSQVPEPHGRVEQSSSRTRPSADAAAARPAASTRAQANTDPCMRARAMVQTCLCTCIFESTHTCGARFTHQVCRFTLSHTQYTFHTLFAAD